MDNSAVFIAPPSLDLLHFVKIFAVKSVQAIVLSRRKRKNNTVGNVTPGIDPFGIHIENDPDVLQRTYTALGINENAPLLKRFPLCVEFTVQTTDGDEAAIEVWSLSIKKSQLDLKQRPLDVIYSRMGDLLKLILTNTRLTPAYLAARNQDDDSYHIYYKVYFGKARIDVLGNEITTRKVGELATQIGTLKMKVRFRQSLAFRTVSKLPPIKPTVEAKSERKDCGLSADNLLELERIIGIDFNQPSTSYNPPVIGEERAIVVLDETAQTIESPSDSHQFTEVDLTTEHSKSSSSTCTSENIPECSYSRLAPSSSSGGATSSSTSRTSLVVESPRPENNPASPTATTGNIDYAVSQMDAMYESALETWEKMKELCGKLNETFSAEEK